MTDARSDVRELATALRVLHHRLLLATQRAFEKLHGRVDGPGAMLQLAVHDSLFAWLRPLSQKVALLDELGEADSLEPVDFARAAAEVGSLLEADPEFHATYLIYLQAEPDAVLANAAVRRVLARAKDMR
jgi:hypothetical protein